MTGVDIQIDWWRTFGRWGSRYTMTALSWTVGVVALVLFAVLEATNKNSEYFCSSLLIDVRILSADKICHLTPSELAEISDHVHFRQVYHVTDWFVRGGLSSFAYKLLSGQQRGATACSYSACNTIHRYRACAGQLLDAPHPDMDYWSYGVDFLLVRSTLKRKFMQLLVYSDRLTFITSQQSAGLGYRGTLVSMCLVLMLIFLFVPWQVAFLGCWAIHLHTCATLRAKLIALEPGALIPLMDRSRQEANDNPSTHTARLADQSPSTTNPQPLSLDGHHLNMHILLLMTWLLPFVAPVLVVWVRTLITAGFTVPFDGDHNFLNVAPFLLLVDSTSSGRGPNIRGRYVICQICLTSPFKHRLFFVAGGGRTMLYVGPSLF